MKVNEILSAWTDLWNGDYAIAEQICAPDFTIFVGGADASGGNPADSLRGGAALAAFIEAFRAERPGLRYSNVRHLSDETAGHGVSLWNADRGDVHLGGIDVFDVDVDGRVRRVWSVSAQRPVVR
jgi:hypothetical protein